MQTEQGKKDMQNTPNQASQEKDPISVKAVLIVDDDVDIGETLMAILQEDTAYQTVSVSDGCAALTVVRTLIPQLILLDYHMPKMDGLECLDKLRESKGLEQTPVILMSAVLPKRARECSNLALIEKPFEMEALLDLMRHLLKER